MSVNQFPKISPVNESNIPVPRRISSATKKSRRCAQLPELQRYIETIIKASNECDPEDSSQSDKDKFPKERKFGSNSLFKGRENSVKQEKNKNQLNWSGSKSNVRAKTSLSDAVSRGLRVYNTYAPEFEDPRNWKLGKTHSLGPSIEIEKFLKKFYPNPYHIEKFKEFKQPENDSKDELRDGTLPDVVISKANIHNEVDIEKAYNDFQTADTESCKREEKYLNLSDTSLETQSTHQQQNKIPDAKSAEGHYFSVPAFSKKPSTLKSSSGKSTASSRASSAESMKETLSRESLRKRKTIRPKSRSKLVKNDSLSDYDIGKLKLLSVSDSEQSISMTCIGYPGANMRDVEISSELCEEIYKAEDFNDLKEIYDIMYKATENFFQIDSKNEAVEYSKNLMQRSLFPRKLNPDTKSELNNPETNEALQLVNPPRTKLELSNSNKTEEENYKTIQNKFDEHTTTPIEIRFEEREPTAVEKSLIDILLKEDEFGYRHNPGDRKPEQVHETVSNYDVALVEETSRVDTPEDKSDLTNTNEKPDEILDFMYGCLKKLNNKEKPSPGDDKKSLLENEKSNSCKKLKKESVTNINYEKPTTSGSLRPADFPWMKRDSTENLLTKTFPNIKDIKSKYSAALSEINRKASRTRCKKRPAVNISGSSSNYQIPLSETPPPENPVTEFQRSAEEIIEMGASTAIQTVESQNELGGFTEEPHEAVIFSDESRIPKPLCPLSVKQNSRKISTGKKLKDVLEAEEKLLTSEKNGKEAEEKPKDVPDSGTQEAQECRAEGQNDTTKVLSHFADFQRPSSNFVVCVNSLPRTLRNTSIRPSLPVPASASLKDIKRNWNPSQTVLASKIPLKNHSLSLEDRCCVLEHTYSIKQEVLLTINKSVVAYTARPVSLKIITHFSKPVEEFSLRSSECLVTVNVIPVQEFAPEEESILGFQMTQMVNTVDDKPVQDLIEAIQETEEKVYLLEQSSGENLYSKNSEMWCLNETLKNEFSESEVEKVNDRQKVYDLLLRTYNLQQKLYRYLQKLSCDQSASSSCPLMQQGGFLDFGKGNSTKIELDIKSEPSLPVVHWHMNSPEIDVVARTDESVTVNVSMVDDSTSYEPPTEAKSDKEDEPKQEKFGKENDEQFLQNTGDEGDDQSSDYSFKSSNDYSELSEAKPRGDYKDLDYMDSKKLFQKIYSEIESFRQSFEAEKLEKQQQQQSEPLIKNQEDPMDKRVAQYDPKAPAKVLRTVFTGKKSSTELTIGLKDVPMTRVGNISVEKTKFSPNHTKISVAFTKETTGERNTLSPYLFDQMRSPLSTCVTGYSGLKDNISKSSQSLNGESDDDDDDEDDYKSVCSNLDNSDLDVNEQKPEPKEQKPVETSTPKTYTKHRFDFYRKMIPDWDSTKSKPKSLSSPVCKYKELEPLKQALTDMQIRMRNIKREAIFNSNDYYERALKLAKMSAGFCQSCGNRAVIPNDTFGYYRTLLPRRSTHHRRNRHFRPTLTQTPSFYSLHSGNMEVGDQFCELGIKHSSYVLNPRFHSNRTVLRNSLHDMPILFERL